MRGRTVLFNHAGAAFPGLLGPACAAALDAFELPVGVNVYCSGSGLATSAPGQGVLQVRFNMSFPRAIVPEKASTRRERSER